MTVYKGSEKQSKIYLGGEQIKKIYKGSELVYNSFTPTHGLVKSVRLGACVSKTKPFNSYLLPAFSITMDDNFTDAYTVEDSGTAHQAVNPQILPDNILSQINCAALNNDNVYSLGKTDMQGTSAIRTSFYHTSGSDNFTTTTTWLAIMGGTSEKLNDFIKRISYDILNNDTQVQFKLDGDNIFLYTVPSE